MAVYKFLNIAALTTVLLLGLAATEVEACRCLPLGLFEAFEAADVVLHATALNRSEQVDIYDDVWYTLDTITLYKEEPDVTYEQEISFTTAGNELLCGVTLEPGEEYLLGLYRHDNGHLWGDSCGLVWKWSWVSDEDEASLEDGCQGDPCNGWCGEFQECRYFPMRDPGIYYCADLCDPSPCAPGEVCTLEFVRCIHLPCPRIANCTASSA